jgi:hypothetical protein
MPMEIIRFHVVLSKNKQFGISNRSQIIPIMAYWINIKYTNECNGTFPQTCSDVIREKISVTIRSIFA